jgi:putative intracellular protease/amidase
LGLCAGPGATTRLVDGSRRKGTGSLLDEKSNPESVAALLNWMRAMDKKVRVMASVCTGAAVLAKCGFLDGLPAATNHSAFSWVAQYGPLVLWDNDARWVDAGKYVTSAGVSGEPTWVFI